MLGLIGVKRVPSLSGFLRKSRDEEDKKFQEAVEAVRRSAREAAVRPRQQPQRSHAPRARASAMHIERSGVCWISGPGYVESVAQTIAAAATVAEAGGRYLRARAYWPDAPDHDFKRHLRAGLKVLHAAAKHFELQVVSEIIRPEDADLMAEMSDVIEIGPHAACDLELLDAVRQTGRNILIHRHPMLGVERFLGILDEAGLSPGDTWVVEQAGRNLDEPMLHLSAMRLLKRISDYPLLVSCRMDLEDPSFIEDLTVAAIAAGADGISAEFPQFEGCSKPSSEMALQLEGMMQRAKALKYTLNALHHHKQQHQ